MRKLNCACESDSIDHAGYCEGFVAHNPQEYKKAENLFQRNPVSGTTGTWYRLYKKCENCRFFCK